jgi:hypothetical protein
MAQAPGIADLRGIALVCGLILCGALPPTAQAADVSSYSGGYNGVGKAAGMAMVLTEDGDEVDGRLVDGARNIYRIAGRIGSRTARGQLSNASTRAVFELDPNPSGMAFVLVPLTGGGELNQASAKRYEFVRGPVKNPALQEARIMAPSTVEPRQRPSRVVALVGDPGSSHPPHAEQSPERRSSLARVPVPRERPVVFAAGSPPASRVDDLVLSKQDQSAQVARPEDALSFGEGPDLELRGTEPAVPGRRLSAAALERIQAHLRPRPRRVDAHASGREAAVPPMTPIDVPVPRARLGSGG